MKTIALLSWVTLLLLTAVPPSLSAAPLRAGQAKVDITPATPVTLSGYASRTELSRGVHDPLAARVIAFEQGEQRLVLVSTDIIGYYGDTAARMRQAILDQCQLQPSALFLTAIHTHSAPGLSYTTNQGHANNVAYTKTLESQLVNAVQKALAQTVPVSMGYGAGASPVGANRREYVVDNAGNAKIRLGRNPTVLTDREVQVVKIFPTENRSALAVLFAYATHSTAMGPRNYLIGGDVHGLAEQFIERYHNQQLIAPAFAGASGNIDPWYRVLPEFKTTNGWIPEAVLLGTLLGEEVVHVADSIQKGETDGPIKTAFKTLRLPGKPRGETNAIPANFPPAPLNVTVGRIGDLAFVGLGGEVFHEIGQKIKAASPFAHTVVITHCNGAAGYLPTAASHVEGGYEVQSSPFAPGAEEMTVREVIRLLHEIMD